jgi:aminodeoxyfutalosine synthase
MTLSTAREQLLADLGLDDLLAPARQNAEIRKEDLRRVVDAGNPIAAAALADARRAAVSDVVVTHPRTLRVRGPRSRTSDPMLVSFALGDLGGIEATEAQLLGPFPPAMPLAQATELVRLVHHERPDLQIRAFTADDVLGIVRTEGRSEGFVLDALSTAGLTLLDWRSGEGTTPETLAVHEAAHAHGVRSLLPIAYEKGDVASAFLDRLEQVRRKAEWSGGFLSVVPLPATRERRSPLDGTAGTEDALAFALVRLALGHAIAHVTVDAHVLGHKLGAILLSHGADDFVGAQAARKWAPRTDDGPRPLSPARVRAYLIEARSSPVLRDGVFAQLDA